MKKYNEKQIKDNKGITLISLLITIIVMLIIVSVSINIGRESLDNTRLQAFYTQLSIIQKRVDDIASTNESYIASNGSTIYLMEQGTSYSSLSGDKQETLKNIIQKEGTGLALNYTKFRYFTIQQLENILGLKDMVDDVFIDFSSRTIIAEKGINISGTEYHILKNEIYYVKQDNSNKSGEISKLKINLSNYGKDYYYSTPENKVNTIELTKKNNYKITVNPLNKVEDIIQGGILKYKKATNTQWEIADGLEFTISELIEYDIIYEDSNKNSVTVTIDTSLMIIGNTLEIEL